MKNGFVRSMIGLSGLGLLIAGTALPAQAAHSPIFTTQRHGAGTDITSNYLAGFTNEAAGSGFVESMTIPTLDCSDGVSRGIAVGMGDEPTDGKANVLADIYATCVGGVAHYNTDVFVKGKDVQGPAAAGDVVAFAVTYGKKGKVKATTTNTTNAAGTVTVKGKSPAASLHFGAFPLFDDGGNLISVPTFVTFRLVKANAAGAPLLGATCLRYQRYNGAVKEIDVTDTIRMPPNQGSFSIVWKHN